MNKIILTLLMTILFIPAANAQNCVNSSRCDELGYTKTTADCAGLDTLVCPFDKNKAFCTTGVTGGITSCNELITAINNQETEILLAKDITCSFADFKLGPLVTNSNTLEASFTFPPNVTLIGLGGKKKLTIPSFKTIFSPRPISIVVDNATFKNIAFASDDFNGVYFAASAKSSLNLENCGGGMLIGGNVNFNGKNNFDVLSIDSGTANVPEGAILYTNNLSVADQSSSFIIKGTLSVGDDYFRYIYPEVYGKYFHLYLKGECDRSSSSTIMANIYKGGTLYMYRSDIYDDKLDIKVVPGAQIAYQYTCQDEPKDCTSSKEREWFDSCESGLWQAHTKGTISNKRDWYKLLTRIGDYQE